MSNIQGFQRIQVAPPTKPANNGTVTLFDSTVAFSKMGLAMVNAGRFKLSFPGLSQASATDGLKGYVSGDGGTTWSLNTFAASGGSAVLPATVAADSASDSDAFDIYIGCYPDVKFTFTAGATAPSAASWAMVSIFVECGNVHSGT